MEEVSEIKEINDDIDLAPVVKQARWLNEKNVEVREEILSNGVRLIWGDYSQSDLKRLRR